VRDFHGELLVDVLPYYWPCEPPYLAASPVAVAADGAGGAYLLLSDVDGGEATPKLFHRDSTGSPDPSWPAAGVTPYQSGGREAVDYGADWSLRLFPEVAGGVFALLPCYYSEGFSEVDLFRFAPAGTYSGWTAAWGDGLESLVPPTGETWFATYFPHGPMSPFSPDAFLHLDQTAASGASGPGFTESHDQAAVAWYGDIGLAPTSNAGAIFAWSQEHERFGIFARRFAPGGQVTAVEPAIAPARALRLRFAPGRGVVVTPGRVAGGRVLLYDPAGRVCAGADVAAGEHEVTIEGTAALASGIYFARHRGSDGAIETGRVVVIR
jgi:hypothetical protein